jgi:aminomethyltransferase
MGTVALEMSRIEAGFIQAGIDFLPADRAIRPERTRSPFELDLGRMVDLAKPNFTGRRALLEEQRRGPLHRLVRLDVAGNKPAKDAFVYDDRRNVIGTVTSAMWSPSAKANIALASVKMPWGRPGDELFAEIYYQKELKWNRTMARCRVVEGPFFDPPRRRTTPAPDF